MCILTVSYTFSFRRHLFHSFSLSRSPSIQSFCKVEAIFSNVDFKLFIFFKWRKQQQQHLQHAAAVNEIRNLLSAIYQSHDWYRLSQFAKSYTSSLNIEKLISSIIRCSSILLFLLHKYNLAWHTRTLIHINLSQLIYRFKTISMFQIVCKGV